MENTLKRIEIAERRNVFIPKFHQLDGTERPMATDKQRRTVV